MPNEKLVLLVKDSRIVYHFRMAEYDVKPVVNQWIVLALSPDESTQHLVAFAPGSSSCQGIIKVHRNSLGPVLDPGGTRAVFLPLGHLIRIGEYYIVVFLDEFKVHFPLRTGVQRASCIHVANHIPVIIPLKSLPYYGRLPCPVAPAIRMLHQFGLAYIFRQGIRRVKQHLIKIPQFPRLAAYALKRVCHLFVGICYEDVFHSIPAALRNSSSP